MVMSNPLDLLDIRSIKLSDRDTLYSLALEGHG